MNTEAFNIIIPNYPEEILISKERRAKYWTKDKEKHLPQKYITGLQAGALIWKLVKTSKTGKREEIRLVTEAGEHIVKNPISAGKPRTQRISGQIFWEGGEGSEWTRQKVKKALTAYFSPAIARQLPKNVFTKPEHFIQLEFIFYYPLTITYQEKRIPQDDDNHAFPYIKAFRDTLEMMGVISSDGPNVLRGSYARYVDIPTKEDRRLEVKFHFCKNAQAVTHE